MMVKPVVLKDVRGEVIKYLPPVCFCWLLLIRLVLAQRRIKECVAVGAVNVAEHEAPAEVIVC